MLALRDFCFEIGQALLHIGWRAGGSFRGDVGGIQLV
jgi:hypothetical protein